MKATSHLFLFYCASRGCELPFLIRPTRQGKMKSLAYCFLVFITVAAVAKLLASWIMQGLVRSQWAHHYGNRKFLFLHWSPYYCCLHPLPLPLPLTAATSIHPIHRHKHRQPPSTQQVFPKSILIVMSCTRLLQLMIACWPLWIGLFSSIGHWCWVQIWGNEYCCGQNYPCPIDDESSPL